MPLTAEEENKTSAATRKIEFTKGPFAFDRSGKLRCTKCGDFGWIADGYIGAGISWSEKKRLKPNSKDKKERLPEGWKTVGQIEPSELPSDTWRQILQESWLHIRHVETQRLGYASLYGGLSIVSGILTLTASQQRTILSLVILVALGSYSVIQATIAEKLAQAIEHDQEHISLLFSISQAEPGLASAMMLRPMDGMIVAGKWIPVKTRRLIPLLYLLLGLGWLALAAVVAIWHF